MAETRLYPGTDFSQLFRARMWPWAVVVLVITLAVYAPVAGYGFVWDDRAVFEENDYIRSWRNLPWFFTQPKYFHGEDFQGVGAYRPLLNVSYLLGYKLHGIHAGYMHLTNALLHGFAASVLFLFLVRLQLAFGGDSTTSSVAAKFAATIGALAWAVHPLATEAVAWIKGRDDLLCTLFYMGSLLLLLKRIRRGASPGAMTGIVILYVCALFTKEMAISFPLVAAALIHATRASMSPRWDRRHLLLMGLLVLATLGFLALRTAMLGTVKQVPYLAGSFPLMMASMVRSAARYLGLITWPWPPSLQNVDYEGFRLSSTWAEPSVIGSTLLMLLLAAIVVMLWKRLPLAAIGLLFCAFTFAPVSNIVPMMQVMAERFAYLPLIGWAIITAAWTHSVFETRWRITLVVFSCVYLGALAAGTRTRLHVWQDEVSLFRSAFLADPANARAASNYGQSLLAAGKTEQAASVATTGMQHNPRDPRILRVLARVEMANGDTTAAASLLQLCMRSIPERLADDWMQLGAAYARAGEPTLAVQSFQTATQIKPDASLAWYNLALAQMRTGEIDKARESVIRVRQLEPRGSAQVNGEVEKLERLLDAQRHGAMQR